MKVMKLTAGAIMALGLMSTTAIADGGTLYEENCVSCHGSDLVPVADTNAFDLREFPDDFDRFKTAVLMGGTNNGENMPAQEGVLSDDDIQAIYDYVKSL